MAEPIGALRAELSANAAQFEQDMQRARNAVRNAGGDMSASMARFEKATTGGLDAVGRLRGSLATLVNVGKGAALGVAAVTAGVAAVGKGALDAADEIAKAADRTGLGVVAFQELSVAARLGGVSAEEFEQAMTQLNKRISEGVVPYRTTAGALAGLAEEIAKQPDGAKRAAIAFENFGRSGVKLIPMLKDGREGLNRAAEEARRLGIIFDENLVRGAEKANDAMEILGLVLKRNVQRAFLDLAPIVTDFATKLSSAAADIRSVYDIVFKPFAEEGEAATLTRIPVCGVP